MGTRIAEIRKALGITQTQFAEQLGLSKNFISLVENGGRDPSNRTITDICHKFGVSEEWIRYGTGTMFIPQSRDEEIAAFIGNTLSTDDDNFKKRLISVLAKLSVDEWVLLEKVFRKTIEETKNNPDD